MTATISPILLDINEEQRKRETADRIEKRWKFTISNCRGRLSMIYYRW